MNEDLNRAWIRRGWGSPSPWSQTLPEVWTPVEFIFYRYASPGDDDFGGFDPGPGAGVTIWIVKGTLDEVSEAEVLTGGEASGPIIRRYYRLFVPFPEDLAVAPSRGDRVTFVDSLGRARDVALTKVEDPQEMNDHLEITTEEY